MTTIEQMTEERNEAVEQLDALRNKLSEVLHSANSAEDLARYYELKEEYASEMSELCNRANALSEKIIEEKKAIKKAERDEAKRIKTERIMKEKYDALPESFKNAKGEVMEMTETEKEYFAEMYLVDLFERVQKRTGGNEEILRLNFNGRELVGIITGEIGTVEVRTIFAGGYNIQKLHFRTIVTNA